MRITEIKNLGMPKVNRLKGSSASLHPIKELIA